MKKNDRPIILIVDDAPTNVEILAEALRGKYHIKVAGDSETALSIAHTEPYPDLILLDIMMPDMDGFEVCKRLKRDPQTKHIPIIFVTAKSEEQDEEYGLKLGAVDYITKPFSIAITKARIHNHMRLKKQADLLESQSLIDPLTQIPNRRQLNEKLELEWKRAAREKTELSVLMIDVDHFKEYNDYYGHGTGDICLEAIATALSGGIARPSDMVARFGGEEFVVILPETDLQAAQQLAEKLRENVVALSLRHRPSPIEAYVTVSIGGATTLACPHKNGVKMLLDAADKMLYQAKQTGRNRVICQQLDVVTLLESVEK